MRVASAPSAMQATAIDAISHLRRVTTRQSSTSSSVNSPGWAGGSSMGAPTGPYGWRGAGTYVPAGTMLVGRLLRKGLPLLSVIVRAQYAPLKQRKHRRDRKRLQNGFKRSFHGRSGGDDDIAG